MGEGLRAVHSVRSRLGRLQAWRRLGALPRVVGAKIHCEHASTEEGVRVFLDVEIEGGEYLTDGFDCREDGLDIEPLLENAIHRIRMAILSKIDSPARLVDPEEEDDECEIPIIVPQE